MPSTVYFITHPDVRIDPAAPVTEWPLSPRGRARMTQALVRPWVRGVRAVWCSTERKARDGAQILAGHLGLPITELAELGENDRSATGYLPKAGFETVPDQFFAHPEQSVRGWERGIDAQRRIVGAVERIHTASPGTNRPQDHLRGELPPLEPSALTHRHTGPKPAIEQILRKRP
jgi:broad specificity phosphatase PhoE